MVKNNKLFKVLAIVLAIICIVSITGVVHAITADQVTQVNPGGNLDFNAKQLGGKIYYAIQTVGIVAGVVIIAYMGIKYITSSPDGKAEIKKQAYVYILGAAFLMAAPAIANVIFNLATFTQAQS